MFAVRQAYVFCPELKFRSVGKFNLVAVHINMNVGRVYACCIHLFIFVVGNV